MWTFGMTGSVVAESVTGEQITTQIDRAIECSELKCSVGTQFCSICCRGQGYLDGTCVKGANYYNCQCVNEL